MLQRRNFLAHAGTLACAAALQPGMVRAANTLTPTRVSIAVPGPGNLLFLPITLASRLGADQLEGIEFDIRYFGGGPQAYRDMLERNADFSAGGLAALALQRLNGKPVVSIAPTTRVPAYTLMVRMGLKGKVRTIGDLRGRVVGVKGLTPGGRSTSQLFTEYVLTQHGVKPDAVNYVSVGQSYDSQHAALASGTVDAIMGDEPFATRMAGEKVGFALADFHDLDATRKLMGGLFLNGNVATREDVIASRPELVEKVVRTLVRTLTWIDTHSARDMVEVLAADDPAEKAALENVLRIQKRIYAPDVRFSQSQLASVTRFLHATEPAAAAQRFDARTVINARWAGTAP